MTKHLLIISAGFAPWGGPAAMRATKLAACGLRQGFRVSVLTTSVECAHVFDDPDLLCDVERAEILRVSDGTGYRWRSALASRFGHYPTRAVDKLLGKSPVQWADACLRAARGRWDDDPPDVVYCTPPPHHVVSIAQQLARQWDIPFLMDFRDPPWEIGMPVDQLEHAMSACDLAVFNTPPAAQHMQSEFSQYQDKIECWTNGADEVTEEYVAPSTAHNGSSLQMVFAGGVYPWVVDAIALLQPHIEDGKLRLDVYGFLEAKRRRQLRQLAKTGATLHDPIPSRQLAERMARASANLVTLPPAFQMSSKVYPTIASGRAVVLYGDTAASVSILNGVPGIFSYACDSSPALIDTMLKDIAGYDPVAGWRQRYQWLQPKTWPNIFSGIFERYW